MCRAFSDKQLAEIEMITKIYRQQRNHQKSGNAKESIPNRIVSVNKPYVRPIVRGKEIKKVEFGAKCNNILIDGMSFIEKLSFNAFNEGTRLVHCVKLAEKLFGEKITKIGGDCSYSGNDNRTFCSDENIVTSFVQKGKSGKHQPLSVWSGKNLPGYAPLQWKDPLEHRRSITDSKGLTVELRKRKS